jgi:hypothetical protein
MANQFATNFPTVAINGSVGTGYTLWKLTRLMKAAGWQYRASGLQGDYDTSGIAANDLWGYNTNPNNDTYTNLSTSTGVGIYNGNGGVTLPLATIPYSNDGGSIIYPSGGTVSILTTVGWQNVTYTAATGLTAGSSGNLTGCSGGTGSLVAGGSGAASAIVQGANNVSVDSTFGWWVAAGPLTVKIPLASNPTGTPLRGEVVTQATTGATGEYLGHVWDPVGLTGWMVILPRHTPQNTTIASGSNNTTLPQGTINVGSTAGFGSTGILNVWSNQIGTTIAAGSNGVVLAQTTLTSTTLLSSSSIPVASTANFSSTGVFYVNNGGSINTITYTGTSGGNTFTGCTGGSASPVPVVGTVANSFGVLNVATSSNFNTNSGTIYVQSNTGVQTMSYVNGSTTVFDNCYSPSATGTISTGNNVYTQPSLQQIFYTGISGNSFTGCTGGTGQLLTGNNVTGYSFTFDSTDSLTGSTSGATFSPTGTVTYFQREVMIGKPTSNTSSAIYYVAADGYLENNQLFSTLATSGGVGAANAGSAWPGGGGTNNGFSIVSTVTGQPMQICVIGAGASLSGTTTFTSVGTIGSTAQLCAVNAIPGAGVTADGSFYAVVSTSTVNQMTGLAFTRVDDCEPGDCDPYAWLFGSGYFITSFSRTANSGFAQNLFTNQAFGNSSGFGNWIGYQARGCTLISHDVPYCWTTAMYWAFQTTPSPIQSFSNTGVNTLRLVAHPAITSPLVREPMLLFTVGVTGGANGNTYKQIKGRARWLIFASVGNALDTMDNKTWLAVSNWTQSTLPCILIGPYDGVSTPIP